MRNHVAIVGGFSGTALDQGGATILSGEIGNPGDTSDNTKHVINNQGLSSTAILANVTVRDGNAGPYPEDNGGGMYNNASSPTIISSKFLNNKANSNGGGMYNKASSSPIITSSTFSNNNASLNGGGMYNDSSSPTITNSTFSYNNASSNGGGMYNDASSPTIINSTFSNNNVSNSNGGGMHNDASSPTITASTFSENTAIRGGGMSNLNSSSPNIYESTFSGNRATDGGGLHSEASSPNITSSTFSGNNGTASGGGMLIRYGSSPSITSSTFSSNISQSGGAFFIDNDGSGVVTIVNSLIWGNSATTDASHQIYMYTDAEGGAETLVIRYSLLEGGATAIVSTGGPEILNIISQNISSSDPELVALANNGGPVMTHAFSTGSSAEDNGRATGWDADNNLCFSNGNGGWLLANIPQQSVTSTCIGVTEVTTDARGYARDNQPDYGAFELNGTPPAP